jgi:hypothetical protein
VGLEYEISNRSDSFSFSIPIANYYKDEGLFFNATSYDNWKGFNDEQYYFKREKNKVFLYDAVDEKLIYELSLEEFDRWINELIFIFGHLEISTPVIDILKTILTNDFEVVNIEFN